MGNDANVTNVELLHQFSRKLNQSSGALNQFLAGLTREVNNVCGNGWDDDSTKRFLMSLDQSKKEIQRLIQELLVFSNYVESKAKILDAYKHK